MPGPWEKRLRENILVFVFVFLAVIAGAVIAYLKIDTALSWRYASDIFSYDTVIQENARGFWGLDFSWGNIFGEHAYFIFILLTPLKFLLHSRMIYVLLILGPLFYSISAIMVFFVSRLFISATNAFFLSLIYLLGFGYTFRGLHETFYGMHPDTLAGFIAVAMTAALIWREHNQSQNKNSTFQTLGAVLFLLLFLAIKEQTALLAVIYFGVAFLFRRTSFHRNMAILSLLVFAIGFAVVELSQTPFNRTNEALVTNIIRLIRENGLQILLIDPNGNALRLYPFWYIIILCSLVFMLSLRFSKQRNPYVISLFITGAVQLFFSLSIPDFSLLEWHNFPALVMLSSAILLQFLFIDVPRREYSDALLIGGLAISVFCFIAYEIPYIKAQLIMNADRKEEVKIFAAEFTGQIMKEVDPMKVVSLPLFAVKHWGGYRYTFYPRGVSMSPVGLADYIVYPINKASRLAFIHNKLPLKNVIPNTFMKILMTKNFILYKRISFSREDLETREFFNKYGIK